MAMPKFAARKDANHSEIENELLRLGFSIQDCSRVGEGFPDEVVGKNGWDFLVEFKVSDGSLNDKQIRFHREWRGKRPIVLKSISDVYKFNRMVENLPPAPKMDFI